MADIVAFDTETHLIQPGLNAPPLVCGSVAGDGFARLLDKREARGVFRDILRGKDLLAGANLAYDFGVMLADAEREAGDLPALLRLVFATLDANRGFDILRAQELHAIALGDFLVDPRSGKKDLGRYSLETVVRLVLGRDDAKANDFWRLRYALLENVPLAEWPAEARQYPVDDAVNTREVALAQCGFLECPAPHAWDDSLAVPACKVCRAELSYGTIPDCTARVKMPPHRNIHRVPEETRVALALHLGSMWGLRVDGTAVDALEKVAREKHREFVSHFQSLGLWAEADEDGKEKKDGKAIKVKIAIAYGANPESKCPACAGVGKRPSHKTKKPVGCAGRSFPGEVTCDGTGLDLSTAPMLPRTKTGGVTADRDALLESGDDDLVALGDNKHEKVITTHVPFLRLGVDQPLNLRPNVLVSSFRTSYDGIIQQMPVKGDARQCIIARPGRVLCSTDYSGIELCTLAQSCLWLVGWSRMAEIINESGDPGALHAHFGARMAGMSVADFMKGMKKDARLKDFRQAAKAGNFGLPGGMGEVKLCLTKRRPNEGTTVAPDGTVYPGIRFCILLGGAERCGVVKITRWKEKDTIPVCKACVEQAAILRREWFAMFPEVQKYFKVVKGIAENEGEIFFKLANVVRGGVGFTDGANGFFQGQAALGAKRALVNITREMYLGEKPDGSPSPLLGARMPFFVHDEPVSDLPYDGTEHEAAYRICTLMGEGMAELVPDIRTKIEPALMLRWLKSAEAVFSPEGKLIPWSPEGA